MKQDMNTSFLVDEFDKICEINSEDIAIHLSKYLNISTTFVSQYKKFPPQNFQIENDQSESEQASTLEEEVSYIEIQMYSKYLSNLLYRRFGLRRGDRVLIHCDNHPAAEIVACIACMRIGVTFVPVDNVWAHRNSRLSDIVNDCNPAAAICVGADDTDPSVTSLNTAGVHRVALLEPEGCFTVTNDLERDIDFSEEEQEEAEAALNTFLPLYILYTSGSTGRPKGVMGSYEGLVNRIQWKWETIPWSENELICRRTPLVFIDALAEIFSSLLAGIPIWAPSVQDKSESIVNVFSKAIEAGVTRVTLLPSQLDQILNYIPLHGFKDHKFQNIIVSGEPLYSSTVNMFQNKIKGCNLINLYGSTEVAGDVTYCYVINHSKSKNKSTSSRKKINKLNIDSVVISSSSSSSSSSSCIGKVSIGKAIDGNGNNNKKALFFFFFF